MDIRYPQQLKWTHCASVPDTLTHLGGGGQVTQAFD